MGRVERLIDGDVRALARAISTAEEDAAGAAALLREVFHLTGRAVVVGVTGPPGAGKSSGGAILGDRVRMLQHATDPCVFIQSMATRGNLGGLSKAANDAIDLLDAAGYDPIIVETVGVGQDEIEVARSADVVAVVLVPGMGDDIQAIKAGILEIADLFVINKADRPGADRVEADLAYMLSLVPDEERGAPEILRTVAVRDEGLTELIEGVERYLERAGPDRRARRRRDRAESRFLGLLRERLVGRVLEEGLAAGDLERTVRAIADRQTDPYTAVEEILARVEVR
jgi:LAO/AO transport system kinase